jgi:hypothetical protein
MAAELSGCAGSFPLLLEEKNLKTVCSDSGIKKNTLLNGRAASV